MYQGHPGRPQRHHPQHPRCPSDLACGAEGVERLLGDVFLAATAHQAHPIQTLGGGSGVRTRLAPTSDAGRLTHGYLEPARCAHYLVAWPRGPPARPPIAPPRQGCPEDARGGGGAPVSPPLLEPQSPPLGVFGGGGGCSGGVPCPTCASKVVGAFIVGASRGVDHYVSAISSSYASWASWVAMPLSLSAWVEGYRSTPTRFMSRSPRACWGGLGACGSWSVSGLAQAPTALLAPRARLGAAERR